MLPPGEFKDMIPGPLAVYAENFTMIAATVSRNVAMITP